MPATKTAKPGGRLLKIPEAADRCSLSTRYLWQAIASGDLKALHFGKRATRIEEAELDRFIEKARGS